jgi:hypothetical protein
MNIFKWSKITENKFQYILDKIQNAEFLYSPFKHLVIEEFFSDKHLRIILSDPQIHFPPVDDSEHLIDALSDNDYEAIGFPGCTLDVDQYLKCLETNEWDNIHPSLDDGELEGYGLAYRLKSYRNNFIHELMEFMNGPEFHTLLRRKFNLSEDTDIVSYIHKYLTKYEISPHPDIRRKALTYLININKNSDSEKLDIHTHLMEFKDEYKHILTEWDNNTENERFWVPWRWCNTKKIISRNNSLIMFSPDNDTLHAVKLNYDHNNSQRTQIYGNLNYQSAPYCKRQDYRDFEIKTT